MARSSSRSGCSLNAGASYESWPSPILVSPGHEKYYLWYISSWMPGIFDAIPTAALDFGLLAGRRSRWTHWPAPHHWWARDCDHDPGCQVSKRRYDPGKYNLYLKSVFPWRLSLGSWVLDLLCTSISVESQSLRVCFPLELITMLPVPVPESLQNRNFGDQKSLDIILLPDDMRSCIWKAVWVLRSELGLIFLLFMIGLELNVEELVHLGQAGCNLLPSLINPWWLQQKSGISPMSPARMVIQLRNMGM